MNMNCNSEVIVKMLGRASMEFKIFEDMEEQLKLRTMIEEVLYGYTVSTNETSLVTSDIEEKAQMFIAIKRLDGMSEKTLKNYSYTLRKFADFFHKPVISITTMDIRMFLAQYSQGKKASTVNSIIFTFKSFFSWLVTEEYIIKNPMMKIKATKVPKRVRKALSHEELEKLKQATMTLREKALIEFISSTGCRVSEVEGVDIKDIDWNNCTLNVIGKGNKERKVYFSIKAKLLLNQYLKSRNDENSALFVSGKYPYNRLGTRSIEREVANVAERAGIDKAVFPHLLRHTMATHALNNGMSMPVLQSILGHEQASTTQIYAQLTDDNIQYEYRRVI